MKIQMVSIKLNETVENRHRTLSFPILPAPPGYPCLPTPPHPDPGPVFWIFIIPPADPLPLTGNRPCPCTWFCCGGICGIIGAPLFPLPKGPFPGIWPCPGDDPCPGPDVPPWEPLPAPPPGPLMAAYSALYSLKNGVSENRRQKSPTLANSPIFPT